MKLAVILSLRKADCGGASLKFLDILFPFKSNKLKKSSPSKTHLIGVDIIYKNRHTQSIEEYLSLIYKSLVSNLYSL